MSPLCGAQNDNVAPAEPTTEALTLAVAMSEVEYGALEKVPAGAELVPPPKSLPSATAKPESVE